MFQIASRAIARVAIIGLFLSALMPNPVATMTRHGLDADQAMLSPQPDDVSFVALFGSLLLPASTQVELEEDLESREEPERKLKALPVSHSGLGDLHYQLLNPQKRRPDARAVPTRSLAPDPRPPRA